MPPKGKPPSKDKAAASQPAVPMRSLLNLCEPACKQLCKLVGASGSRQLLTQGFPMQGKPLLLMPLLLRPPLSLEHRLPLPLLKHSLLPSLHPPARV